MKETLDVPPNKSTKLEFVNTNVVSEPRVVMVMIAWYYKINLDDLIGPIIAFFKVRW